MTSSFCSSWQFRGNFDARRILPRGGTWVADFSGDLVAAKVVRLRLRCLMRLTDRRLG